MTTSLGMTRAPFFHARSSGSSGLVCLPESAAAGGCKRKHGAQLRAIRKTWRLGIACVVVTDACSDMAKDALKKQVQGRSRLGQRLNEFLGADNIVCVGRPIQ